MTATSTKEIRSRADEMTPTCCSISHLADEQFGRTGWDLNVISCDCVWERTTEDLHVASYQAHVRLSVHDGDRIVCREAIGFGHASAKDPGEALEFAAIAAEQSASRRTIGMMEAIKRLKKAKKNTSSAQEPELQVEPTARDTDSSADQVASPNPIKNAENSSRLLLPVTAHVLPAGRMPIDKHVLTLGEPKRIRSKDHLAFVRTHPCVICGRSPTQAHHVRYAQPRALSRKVSDEYTVPLCNFHHYDVHRTGDERSWWRARHINPLDVALELWTRRHFGDAPSGALNEVSSRS